MQFAPEACEKAWGLLKKHVPTEMDLLTVAQLGGNAAIAEEAVQILEQMRSPEKREFLKRLKS